MRIWYRYLLLLGGVLLCPGSLFAKPPSGTDSLANGKVIVQHHPKRLIKLGRELAGGTVRPGSSRWKNFEIFWGHPSGTGDSRTFGDLRPGKYSVWAFDTTYRLFHESFTLGKGELRNVDARTGSGFSGKKAVAALVDKASKAPISGAMVYYACAAPGSPGNHKLILHKGAVESDSLGGFQTPPCLNKNDTLYVQYLVTPDSKREAFVKITPDMDEDSLWRIGVIPLSDKLKSTIQKDRKGVLVFSALTYSLGIPLSDGEYLHAFSHSLYFRFFGMDYGYEAPNGSLFLNVKGWIPTVPVLKGNWSIPLGILGTGLGLYRTLDEEIGYQAQIWYNLLLAHVNLKIRKDFDGPFHSTLGLGISVPVYYPGRR